MKVGIVLVLLIIIFIEKTYPVKKKKKHRKDAQLPKYGKKNKPCSSMTSFSLLQGENQVQISFLNGVKKMIAEIF